MSALLSGPVLLLAIVITITSHLINGTTNAWAGVAIWVYFLLNLPMLNRRQRIQNIAVITPGIALLAFALWHSPQAALLQPLLNANQLIITLLAAISFLQLTTRLRSEKGHSTGKLGLRRTLFSTHMMSAVINVSAMVLVAERLKQSQKLTTLQGLTLLRAFGTCALWSPFFAAMGATLISAPGAELSKFLPYTAAVGVVAIGVSYLQLIRSADITEFQGYPISFESLKLPLGLAAAVLITHYLLPQISVIMLVSIMAMLLVIALLALRNPAREAYNHFYQHVVVGLPNTRGEIALFISSTVLATGISALQTALQLDLAPSLFDATAASITLTLLVALSLIGVHPVTSNLIAGATLMPATEDPNLLAITLLMAWSFSSILSPLSGNQIILQGRYGVSARGLLKANLPYVLIMMPVCYLALWLY